MNENDFLISMFIDNELDLDGKIEFVERVHESAEFKDEAVSLLGQEKLLRTDMADLKPLSRPAPPRHSRFFMSRPFRSAAVVLSTAVIVLSSVFFWQHGRHEQPVSAAPYRFVIFEPDARRVEIAGSFTSWKKISLEKRGSGGYWEVTLPLSPGEHSFTYILDGSRKVADPTLPSIEMDDFGGENSILYTGGNA
jgi:hypothetical protein